MIAVADGSIKEPALVKWLRRTSRKS